MSYRSTWMSLFSWRCSHWIFITVSNINFQLLFYILNWQQDYYFFYFNGSVKWGYPSIITLYMMKIECYYWKKKLDFFLIWNVLFKQILYVSIKSRFYFQALDSTNFFYYKLLHSLAGVFPRLCICFSFIKIHYLLTNW